LYSDERVVLQAQNVKVKSVSFEVVLTTRRLVLIDTKKHTIPPQEINLATLKDVESGENAIRDPTITISIITISGNTRQMVLTFSKTSGGERRRESDEWVRALRQNITSTVYHPVTQAPPKETEPALAPAPRRIDITSNPPPKKRIEIARPMKKIIESVPAMPVPVETTSLPTGSFCNRCGNRVPPESVFCNRCGTLVVQDTGAENLPPESIDVPPPQTAPPPEPAVPQIQVAPLQVPVEAAEKKERPIEEVIHSIEPLIEDSVPRTAPAPLVPSKHLPHAAQLAAMTEPSGQVPPEAPASPPDITAPPVDVQWPVLSPSTVMNEPLPPPADPQSVPAEPGSAPVPSPVPPPVQAPVPPAPSRKRSFAMIAILALAVLAVIAGVYIFMQDQSGTPEGIPTTVMTVPATTVQPSIVPTAVTTAVPSATPQVTVPPSLAVPQSGVWVKIMYPGKYAGSVGTPGRLKEIENSGEHLYQIPTSEGPVVVSIQKDDGSLSELAVEVYKDGVLIKHAATIAPRGLIEIQTLLQLATETTIPVTTPA
jgi:hypothetical protein